MATKHHFRLGQSLKRGVSALGIISLSVLVTLLVQRALTPSRATAQSSQPQEIRASAFVLVGEDGTVLARLAPGPLGHGLLQINDKTGQQRSFINGIGTIGVFDPNGKQRAAMTANGGVNNNGLSGLNIFDADGNLRTSLYYNADTGNYGLTVRDASNNVIAAVP